MATLRGGHDDDAPWKAICSLRLSGSAFVFHKAKTWCNSINPLKRARAASILGQLQITHRHPWKSEKVFVAESFAILSALIPKETDVYALNSELSALGTLDDPNALPILTSFAQHSDSTTRYAVAVALGSFADDPGSVKALLELMEDRDHEVRDWAIFGLGTLGHADSEEIRQAFFAHLKDPFINAREEATVALAHRRDQRVIRPLINLLKRDHDRLLLLEAARIFLDMEDDPPDWFEAEYIAALEAKFSETLTVSA